MIVNTEELEQQQTKRPPFGIFKEAVGNTASLVVDRLQSGRDRLRLVAEAKQWRLSYHAASTTVSLIPLLTPRSLADSDKQHLLAEVAGLASDAAAVALMADESPYEAIRLLELGRGVITGSLNEIRADLSDLWQRDRDLAEQFNTLRDQLDTSARLTRDIDQPEAATGTYQANQRYDLGQKLEHTIEGYPKLVWI